MTELFNKKYVHFMWEDELEGKEVITGEGIDSLIAQVNRGNVSFDVTRENPDSEFPFYDIKSHRIYRFAYYDPNYECKKAYAEGKQIQFKNIIGNWENDDCPKWHEGQEYRIKPELNDQCNSCKGKSFNCHNCKNKDAEGSYWTLFRENCIVSEEPKSRRMTYRERSEWIAKGNGQMATKNGNAVCSSGYELGDDDKECDDCLIRRWDSDEWIEPTVDVYEADCKKE